MAAAVRVSLAGDSPYRGSWQTKTALNCSSSKDEDTDTWADDRIEVNAVRMRCFFHLGPDVGAVHSGLAQSDRDRMFVNVVSESEESRILVMK